MMPDDLSLSYRADGWMEGASVRPQCDRCRMPLDGSQLLVLIGTVLPCCASG